MPVRLKKLIGTVLLVLLVAVYAIVATIVAVAQLAESGPLVHLAYFFLTGLLWEGALAGFSWYARDLASWNLVHGSIAAVVVFLFWIYICAIVLLYGVETTAAYVRLQGTSADA